MAKEKFYHAWAKATSSNGDEHYVTVVGKFEQSRKEEIVQDVVPVETKPNTIVDGILTYGVKNLNRKLTLGVSICHPSDTFNEEIGINIAKGRINRGQDLGQLETSNVTMLTEDAIMAEILVKLNHICQNIDEYISE
jgi:hypothetical protein